MSVLHNNTARLLVGLTVKGYQTPRWIPGRNPLDPDYWAAVKNSSTIKGWLHEKWITPDLGGTMPNPNKPPSADELAGFSLEDLQKALQDTDVPVQWHPTLEAELKKRELERVEKRVPKTPSARESVTGIRVEDAIPLIEAETDVDKLVAWADADGRKTIAAAIDARIAELELEAEVEADGS